MIPILIERFAYNLVRVENPASGTFGVMTLPSGRKLYTVERPWDGNKPSVSCIPEGVYSLKKRVSPVVARTTRNRYKSGWEVTGVPNRTYIMFHPGNYPEDLQGCIAPGVGYTVMPRRNGLPGLAVTDSQSAFDIFMGELSEPDGYELIITSFHPEYP